MTHYRRLPNDDVLDLMRSSDYLVFPTLHDTFGYVAIEALSRGTPVIATDVCALPEMVDDGRSGYLLPFDKDDEVGRWRYLYQTADPAYQGHFEAAIELLATGIANVLTKAWDQRSSYEAMSAAAIERVRIRFSRVYAYTPGRDLRAGAALIDRGRAGRIQREAECDSAGEPDRPVAGKVAGQHRSRRGGDEQAEDDARLFAFAPPTAPCLQDEPPGRDEDREHEERPEDPELGCCLEQDVVRVFVPATRAWADFTARDRCE